MKSLRFPNEGESLFERFPWLYAFCRDHLFRDDTRRITAALWDEGAPPASSELLEVGCGPGFYTRRLAGTFEQLRVTGVDSSERQLCRARTLAASGGLENCLFTAGDACDLPVPDDSFDAVIASRLFIIMPRRRRALAEMHRVLRPGGRCFIAEPRSALRAAVPLRAMWLLADLASLASSGKRLPFSTYREPFGVSVMSPEEFGDLIGVCPWESVHRSQDLWYQYAVCEKSAS